MTPLLLVSRAIPSPHLSGLQIQVRSPSMMIAVEAFFVSFVPDPFYLAGLKLKRERTYLGTKKAHSISIDLTTLQGQKRYIRDTKISQAQTENVKPEKPLSQEHKDPINLAKTTTPDVDEGRDKEDAISRAASLRKSVPRVGTVKRVARGKSALPASPSSTMSANTRTRPHSATGEHSILSLFGCLNISILT